jgi:hypothetical protein
MWQNKKKKLLKSMNKLPKILILINSQLILIHKQIILFKTINKLPKI